MPEEGSQVEGWKQNIETMKNGIEKELDYIKGIEDKIAKPIALRHRDFHTVIKDSKARMNDIIKELEKLEDSEKLDPNTAAKLYEKIFDDLTGTDEDFMIAFLSTVSILRAFSAYYKGRMFINKYYEALGTTLEGMSPEDVKKLQEIHKREEAAQKEIEDVVHRLDQITSSKMPVGPLIDASKEMRDILQVEGVSAWIERRRQMRKTAGKALA